MTEQTQTLSRIVTVCAACGVVDGVTLPANKLDTDDPDIELMPSYYHHERCGAECGDIIYETASRDIQTALDEGAATSYFEREHFDWFPPGVDA